MVVLPPTVVVPVVPEVEARRGATVEEDMVVAMEIRQGQEPSLPGGNALELLGWLLWPHLSLWLFNAAKRDLAIHPISQL